ncbi:hypothetical protein LTR50_001970 [Elasticomyces elasticus]|nr:hypothetical protein LTR50_001970 [Elasticomyces elasticus]
MATEKVNLPGSQHEEPIPQQPPQRVFHIYLDGISHRHDKKTALYKIDANSGSIFSSKPHMSIYRCGPSQTLVGAITFHSMSSDIDVEIHGKAASLCKGGLFTRTYEFRSQAAGTALWWKGDGAFSSDLKLVGAKDAQGSEQVFARFDRSAMAMSKEGKLLLASGLDEIATDEVVVSGMAVIEHARRKRNE